MDIYTFNAGNVTLNTMSSTLITAQGDSGGNVNGTNSNVLINFTVADAAAQSALVNALSDSTLSEYLAIKLPYPKIRSTFPHKYSSYLN